MRIFNVFFSFFCLVNASFGFASVYEVTTIADSGAGSLRQAITDANASAGADNIVFKISSGCVLGECRIILASGLPAIEGEVSIDGFSQSTFAGGDGTDYLVILDGSSLSGSDLDPSAGLILKNTASGSTVKGMVIQTFAGEGMRLEESDHNIIQANRIGTDPEGTLSLGNGRSNLIGFRVGIRLLGSSNNEISENVISGNGIAEIFILDSGTGDSLVSSDHNSIVGNYIGTNANGTAVLPGWLFSSTQNSNGIGIYLYQGKHNLIESNVVGGSKDIGVLVDGDENTVKKNKIGTSADGVSALSNGFGIKSNGNLNLFEENIVSSNSRAGVGILWRTDTSDFFALFLYFLAQEFDNERHANVIRLNKIGIDANGEDLGNGGSGIILSGLTTETLVEKNTIAFNGFDAKDENHPTNKGIGTAGIYTSGVVNHQYCKIPPAPSEDCFIPNHSLPSGNRFTENQIYANKGLGIDRGYYFEESNKIDVDADPNNGIQPGLLYTSGDGPTLNSETEHTNVTPLLDAIASRYNPGAQAHIVGTIRNGEANTAYRLEFFSNPSSGNGSPACLELSLLFPPVVPPVGYVPNCVAPTNPAFWEGEGKQFIGFGDVTTDGSGDANFTFDFTGSLPSGNIITATATRVESGTPTETYEFSQAVKVFPDEICDGVDNDGDGLIDEDLASVATSCGVGACASNGTLTCVSGSLVDSCTAGSPSAEVCNNIDDDCDNSTDEDLVPVATSCGVGACARTGSLTCVSGSLVDSCTAGSPSAEVCNNIDDDCDNLIDESGYKFAGFFTPVDNPTIVNLANAGSAVPLKFKVTNCQGAPVTNLTAPPLVVTVMDLNCSLGSTGDQLEEYAAGSSGLINKGNGEYQFNWKTPKTYAKSCKEVRVNLGDGILHKALFNFTR